MILCLEYRRVQEPLFTRYQQQLCVSCIVSQEIRPFGELIDMPRQSIALGIWDYFASQEEKSRRHDWEQL